MNGGETDCLASKKMDESGILANIGKTVSCFCNLTLNMKHEVHKTNFVREVSFQL